MFARLRGLLAARAQARPRTRLGLEPLDDRSLPSAGFGWATAVGDAAPPATSSGAAVATDAAGNVYTVGTFSGDFASPAGPLTAAGGTDIYVAKYSGAGVLQWTAALGGAGNDQGKGVAVDSAGGTVYVAGQVNGAGYVAALGGGTGSVTWAKALPGATATAAAVDASGAAYVASDGRVVTGTTTTYTTYLTKLGPAGTQQWQDRLTGGVAQSNGLATSGGTVYLAGTLGLVNSSVTVTTTSGSTTLKGTGYVLAVAGGGQLAWSHAFQPSGSGGVVWSAYVAADPAGNVYAAGNFQSKVNFGGSTKSTGVVMDGTSGGDQGAVYVVKLDPRGNLAWAERVAVPTASGCADVHGIAADGSGAVYLTGAAYGATSFNPAGGGALGGDGAGNAFVAKYDTGGAFQWAAAAGGAGYDVGTGIAVDPAGDVYTAGTLQAGNTTAAANYAADFDPATTYADGRDLVTTSSQTAFLWQLTQP